MNFLLCSAFILLAASLAAVLGSPKKYNPSEENSFQPSNNRYYESNLPGNHSDSNNNNNIESKISKDSERLRFGIPLSTSNYGNTGSGVGYGNTGGVGYMMSPMKIDIGGIALGALIGLGAVLIIPKLASVFTGLHGGGYRSLEEDMSSITNVLSRIDTSLEQNNIDSSSCMQRVICSYVNQAQKNMKTGEANSVDQFVFTMANNSLFTNMLDGTAVREAIETGKLGDVEKCTNLFAKCPLTKENVIKVIANFLPS